MKFEQAIAAAAVVVSVAMTASIASGAPVATKQRVAIEVMSSYLTGNGTFELIPLSPGPLRRDSGTVKGTGDIKPSVVRRNGQRVTVVLGSDRMTGTRGTFRLTQRVQNVDAGSSYGSDTGSWSLRAGTGVYADLLGGGGLAGVSLPNGQIVYRQEGYIRTG